MANWYFPSNDHGEIKGINDSGVALFRGRPLQSLAREICQNSLDAAREETITVEFSAFQIPSKNLPGFEYLTEVFNQCADYWSHQRTKKTKEFFANAIDKITADKIDVLRISDFNTTGLTGSKKGRDSDWTSLTKSSGVSDKKGTAGGSFGIGKYAPFACSDFSTVFYSTFDEENIRASQGVSRLVTFERADGETTQGTGYYGEEQNSPMEIVHDLDPEFSRGSKEYGTDIYIIGYNHAGDEWEDEIIVSVLDSFLVAIWKSKLVLKVGEHTISSSNLGEYIEIFRDQLTGYTAQYYEVITSKQTQWITDNNFMGLGKVELALLIGGNERNRKVAMIRQTGMKIKDQDRINKFIQFTGVMFIDGDKINEKLRKLENPEHTKWEVDRPETAAECAKARALVKGINEFVKKELNNLVNQGTQDDVDVSGLSSLLPDEIDESNNESKEEDIPDTTKEVEKRIAKKKYTKMKAANSGGVEGTDPEDGSYTDGDSTLGWVHRDRRRKKNAEVDPYPSSIDPDGGEKIPKPIKVEPQKLRFICIDKSKGQYMLLFTPNKDGEKGIMNLYMSAETQTYPAPIAKASIIGGKDCVIENNCIKELSFVKGTPLRMNLYIDYSDYCSMEVNASAYKK